MKIFWAMLGLFLLWVTAVFVGMTSLGILGCYFLVPLYPITLAIWCWEARRKKKSISEVIENS
jgi:hypothetical protein